MPAAPFSAACCRPARASPRVGISGGAGILFTDRAIARGLTLAKLGEDTNKTLRAAIPSFGSISNPVDVTAVGFQRRRAADRRDQRDAGRPAGRPARGAARVSSRRRPR